MSISLRMGLPGYMSVLGIFVLACGDGATTTAPPNAALNRGSSVPVNFAAAKSQVVTCSGSSSTPGSIVYTTGTIHTCNLLTGTDVSLGISGVNPKFSPPGNLITYQATSGHNQGIYVMFSNGAGKKLVSSSGGMPSFNPAGNMIAFDNNGIWTSSVTVAGTTITVGVPKQIVAVGVGLGSAWSQNGSQIAYIRMLNNTEKLMVVNVSDGSPVDSLSMSGGFLDVVWQPSSKILFSHSGDLYSYDPTAGTSTTNPSRLTTSGSGNFYPSWSPAADQISWTNGKTGISIMSALGGTGKLVIPGGTQGSWAQ